MWRGPAWLTVVRDVLCIALGTVGAVREIWGGTPDLALMAFYGGLILGPGALATDRLGRTGSQSQPSATDSPPSSSSPPLPPS